MYTRALSGRLEFLMKKFPVIGIIGPRQVGKTTFVRQLNLDTTIYLDLESEIDRNRLTDPGLFFRNNSHQLIILDEIQEMPELFALLRSIIDEDRRPGRFILLGSAAPSLIRKSSESLAGRIAYIEMAPLLLAEVGWTIENLWVKGGFPEAYLEPDSKLSFEWRKQFIKTYVERDLPALGLDANRRTITNFLTMAAHSNGSVWNSSAVAKSLGITSPTVKKYLDFLEGAFLVKVLAPYSTNAKKRITKSPKVYIRDTGLLHTLLNIQDKRGLEGHPALGLSWESFVLLQVMDHCHDIYDYHFYRTHDGTEMDLVLTKGGKPVITAEIKYSSAPKRTKGMLEAIKDLNCERNFIITPGIDRYPIAENLEVIGLIGFLEECRSSNLD